MQIYYGVIRNILSGYISKEPKNQPGHPRPQLHCVSVKGQRIWKRQLQEAVRRIRESVGARKIVVATNQTLIARWNYESVGFQLRKIEENTGDTAFCGNYLY